MPPSQGSERNLLDLSGNDEIPQHVPPEPTLPAAVDRRRKRVHTLQNPDKMVLASKSSTYMVKASVHQKNKGYGNDSCSEDEDRALTPAQGVAHVTPQHTSF